MAYYTKAPAGQGRSTINKETGTITYASKKKKKNSAVKPIQYTNTYTYQKYVGGRLMDVSRDTRTGRETVTGPSSRRGVNIEQQATPEQTARLRPGQSTILRDSQNRRLRVQRTKTGELLFGRLDRTYNEPFLRKSAESLQKKKESGQAVTSGEIFRLAGYKPSKPLDLFKVGSKLRAYVGKESQASIIRGVARSEGITLPAYIYAQINRRGVTNNTLNQILAMVDPENKNTLGGERYSKAQFSFIDKINNKIAVAEKIIEKGISSSRIKGESFKLYSFAAASFGLGVIKGFTDTGTALVRPKTTFNSLKSFVSQLVDEPGLTTRRVIQGVTYEFTANPAKFIGEYWAYDRAINLLAKTARGSALARVIQKELYLLQQPVEFRPALRTIIDAAESQRLLNPVPKASIKNINFFDVKQLTRVEAKALARALEKTDSVVFGSKAGRALSKGKTKIPEDVDLATNNVDKFMKTFIDELPKKDRSKYTIQKEKILRGKTPVLDVKPLSRLIPQRGLLSRTGLLPVTGYLSKIKLGKGYLPKLGKKLSAGALELKTSPLVKIGKFKFVGFGEQTLRKALGTIQVLLEKNPRRAKDPAALLEALEIQLRALRKTKPLTPIGKLSKASKIKKLLLAVKLLKSKKFQRLLEKSVKGLNKEFPLTKVKRASKAKKVFSKSRRRKPSKMKPLSRVAKKAKSRKKPPAQKRAKPKTKKKAKSKASKLPKRKPSKLPSRLPSRLRSKIPSRVPKKVPSRIPSKVPSRVPSRVPSKTPSRVPSRIPSKTPSRVPSRIPSKLPSRLPSRPIKPVKGVVKPSKNKPPQGVKNPRGYKVYIRTGGKYKSMTPHSLKKGDVNKFGRWLTNNSVSRSFTVVGVRNKGRKLPSYVSKTPPKFFRTPKKNSKLRTTSVVEKRKYAINTRGERKGLSAARFLSAAKRKRKPKKSKK